jgi:hypothetical protein
MTTIDIPNVQTRQASKTSESRQDLLSRAPLREGATAVSPPGSMVIRRSRFARLGAMFTGRRYHHPQRERFVEEAAMSREMFRL